LKIEALKELANGKNDRDCHRWEGTFPCYFDNMHFIDNNGLQSI